MMLISSIILSKTVSHQVLRAKILFIFRRQLVPQFTVHMVLKTILDLGVPIVPVSHQKHKPLLKMENQS